MPLLSLLINLMHPCCIKVLISFTKKKNEYAPFYNKADDKPLILSCSLINALFSVK